MEISQSPERGWSALTNFSAQGASLKAGSSGREDSPGEGEAVSDSEEGDCVSDADGA